MDKQINHQPLYKQDKADEDARDQKICLMVSPWLYRRYLRQCKLTGKPPGSFIKPVPRLT